MRRLIALGLLLGICSGIPRRGSARGIATLTPPSLTVPVPMRDGTRLATDVYLPPGVGPWPVALMRTPYSKTRAHGVTVAYSRCLLNGIAVVAQDVRGRFASEGQARPFVDEGWGERQDGADTVAWIRQQPWCNGKIATFGGSYLGINQLLLAGTGPDGIVGQHVAVGAGSVYHHVFFQNGVWRQGWAESWLKETAWPEAVLPWIRQHPRYDAFWESMDFSRRREQVHWPVVFLSGWFDVFVQSTLDTFTQLQDRAGEGPLARPHLVIGPWMHGGAFGYQRQAGELHFPANAAPAPGASDPLVWLIFWLTGRQAWAAREPAVRYYVMGDVTDPTAPGNTWRAADHWPPASRPRRLYFTARGGLAPQAPGPATRRHFDYDPTQPVPSLGGQNIYMPAGPMDQRPVEQRPDVLLFTSPPLTEPLEVTGRIGVRLYAATSARDTDFTAKLCDVYPDGRSMLVTDGIVRARYRRSLEMEEWITPGQPYAYDIDLWSTSLIFNRGHRIRVAISSSNAPRFEPNANTGESWPFQMRPVVAHQTIFLGGAEASYLFLPEVVETAMQAVEHRPQ